jgi:hypothetical protein
MKKIITTIVILLLLFSFNIYAQETDKLDAETTNSEAPNLSQEKNFSQSAREELLGIASRFDSEEDQEIDQLTFENDNFSLTDTTFNDSQKLNILTDLSFDADYSKEEDEKLETAADFHLEYALNSRTLIRAGYSVLNEEWWDIRSDNIAAANPDGSSENSDGIDSETMPNPGEGEDNIGGGSLNTETAEQPRNNISKIYQNELESSRSLGLAYRTNDRVTLSADFVENNEFGSYYDDNWEFVGDSKIFGVEYNYPEGSSIRARYQVDTAAESTQKITGVDFAFNNLATFSASYKLLDLNQLTDDLAQQKTAWDLGLGVNISEDYGVSLGYELIEGRDDEESEQKVRASFEINF